MVTVQQDGNQYQNNVRLCGKIPCFMFLFQGFTSGGYCPSYLNSVTGGEMWVGLGCRELDSLPVVRNERIFEGRRCATGGILDFSDWFSWA
jgi:hypothetical protein